MGLYHKKSRFLFATSTAFAVAFALIFLGGLLVAPANAAADGWHIKDDATGGECSAIGIWDAGRKTCTLSQDLSQGIIIDSNNIVLGGGGHTITGNNTGSGVYLLGKTGVTIKNLNVKQFTFGIYLYGSNNTLTDNSVSSDNAGIYLHSSNNNTLTGNTASSNTYGISLNFSSNNTLTGNTTSNNYYGIQLFSASDFDGTLSSNNTLIDNTSSNNTYGISIDYSSGNTLTNNIAQENLYQDISVGASLDSHCNNSITNTTGSGDRPIKYFSSATSLDNETLSELILCNADNSNISDIVVDGSSTKSNNGLFLIRTDSSTIRNVNSSNNWIGVSLYYSNNNTLTGNADNTTNSGAYDRTKHINFDGGIRLTFSNNNTLTNNIASNSKISLNGSNNNTLIENTASGSGVFPDTYRGGIHISSSNNNTLTGNTASNSIFGIFLWFSNNNTLTGNTVSNNTYVLDSYSSANNQVYRNNFIDNFNSAPTDQPGNIFNLIAPTGGNYWSNYSTPAQGCADANNDGFCDAPYVFSVGRDNLPWTKKDGWLVPPQNQPDFSIEVIKPIQVVESVDINNDGTTDLVAGKPVVVRVRPKATNTDSLNQNSVVTIELSFQGKTLATTTTIAELVNTINNPKGYIDFYTTPTTIGKFQIAVVIDPNNNIPEDNETNNASSTMVDVKPIRNIQYGYFSVDYLGAVPQFSQTVGDSGDYLQGVYPVAPAQFTNQAIGLPFVPSLTGFSPDWTGAMDDALTMWRESKLQTVFQVERIVGIVPKRWFTYHQLGDSTEGVVFPMVSDAAFVLDERPLVTAHELGHTYGFGEGYKLNPNGTCCLSDGDPTKGFWVQRKLNIQTSIDYMGDSLGAINYPDQATLRWSTPANFAELFRQFRTEPSDPETLLVTGTIDSTGAVVFGSMYRVANGIVSQGNATGDVSIKVLNTNGDVLADVSFKTDFRILTDPPMTTDRAPFAFAVPYPADATTIQMTKGNQVLARVQITTKLLRDAVNSIPDAGFIKNPAQRRDALLNKIDALDAQLANGSLTGASNKLRNDIRAYLENSLLDGYSTQTLQYYTKTAILGLVNELLQRLGG